MAISPIAIATQGLLNSPLSVAAVRGHLTIATAKIVDNGGGFILTGVPGRWKHPAVRKDEILAQLRREDDEILAIIIASIEYIQ